MNFLTCPINTIGDWLTKAAWFQIVKWPFWFFLVLIAFGGVYTAIFKKSTLLCRGITGALKLAMIYMFCIGVYHVFPACMKFATQLPLVSLAEETLTLTNPKDLLSHPFSDFPRNLVPLFGLLLCINLGAHLDYGGRNKLPWFGCQILTCTVSVILYRLLAKVIDFPLSILTDKFAGITNLFYLSIAILLLVPLAVLLTMKYMCIVFRKAGNPTYTKIMQFLCSQHFGSVPFVTFFSELVILIVLAVLHAGEMAVVPMASFNPIAYILIMAMCGGTLLVYSMYFTEHKWG